MDASLFTLHLLCNPNVILDEFWTIRSVNPVPILIMSQEQVLTVSISFSVCLTYFYCKMEAFLSTCHTTNFPSLMKKLQNWTNQHFDCTLFLSIFQVQYTKEFHKHCTSFVSQCKELWTVRNQWAWYDHPYPTEYFQVSSLCRLCSFCVNIRSLREFQLHKILPRLKEISYVFSTRKIIPHLEANPQASKVS